jgi:enamine deaminase RidA (YjgF/YER057c/UK114 family)
MSALPPKADIGTKPRNVRFVPKADINRLLDYVVGAAEDNRQHPNREEDMPRIIETGLQKPPAPHAWAVEAYGIVQSVHVPIRPDGSIESGDATRQTEVTLHDLKATLAAAGATLADVTLVARPVACNGFFFFAMVSVTAPAFSVY